MGAYVERERDRGVDIMRYKWKERREGNFEVAKKGK